MLTGSWYNVTMKIKYVTGNKIKINYANNQLNKFGIEIEQVVLDVHEIQSLEKFAVAEDKAKKAFAILNEPFFVTDTFWEIPALNGFPGAFMKYINNWFVPQDILNLMKDKNDRRGMLERFLIKFMRMEKKQIL